MRSLSPRRNTSTPLNFVAAIQAGKDVYQEKTMAFNPGPRQAHAEGVCRLRSRGAGGHADEQRAGHPQVQELVAAGRLGTITAIQAHHYRNAPYGGWLRQIPADCDAAARRLAGLRGRGQASRLRSPALHELAVLTGTTRAATSSRTWSTRSPSGTRCWACDIPQSATMAGGNYRSPKMEVPDTMSVSLNQSEKLLFTWNSMFGNGYFGETWDYLFGTKGTVLHDATDRGSSTWRRGSKKNEAEAAESQVIMIGRSVTCRTSSTASAAAKTRICPFAMGYRTAIACQMAIASYRLQRTVRWDAQAEDIV